MPIPLSQEAINLNIVNALSIITKSLINLTERQTILFQIARDDKMVDMSLLDVQILQKFQTEIDRLKLRI